MTRTIGSLADLASLDVEGRVIKYSLGPDYDWRFARLTGKSENLTSTGARMVLIMEGQGGPVMFSQRLFDEEGLLVELATEAETEWLCWCS